MKKEKISYILSVLGYPEDQWVDLNGISLIYFKQDSNCFINSNERYKFNFSSNCLEICRGIEYYENDLKMFKDFSGNTSDFTPDSYYSFDLIGGFIRSCDKNKNSIYFQRKI